MTLQEELETYRNQNKVTTKGKLSAILYVSRLAVTNGLPLDSSVLVTDSKGQVKGLGKSSVQRILNDHDVTRVLAEEGGRTSRGSLGNMQDYVVFLNSLHSKGIADAQVIEKWWVDRVKDFFSAKPFTLKYDTSKSLRAIIRDLFAQAVKRQKENPGTMYAGAVLQHLVGAKLSLALKDTKINHNGASVADAPTDRGGDFIIDEVIIHVTTAPSEALMRKCERNLHAGTRPIIVTTYESLPGAESLASIIGIGGRIDILEAEQFIATNVYELSFFETSKRKLTIDALIDKYNEIVEQCETDPSLKIMVG